MTVFGFQVRLWKLIQLSNNEFSLFRLDFKGSKGYVVIWLVL